MYAWLILLHVLSVFVFLLAHGVSMGVAFRLRKERELEFIRGLLTLSADTYPFMYLALLLILVTGIILGFQANWWRFGWIWVSLGLLIAIVVAMSILGANLYSGVRKAVGLPYMEYGKPRPAQPTASAEELERSIQKANPILLTVVGVGGLAVITWLMMFKPF